MKIFVYGTLKPGESNYQQYCASKVVAAQRAITFGQLFALPLGYPAMTSGDSLVYGFLLIFADPSILVVLDDLENYDSSRAAAQNEYNRQALEIYSPDGKSLGTAWAYLMTSRQVGCQGGMLLPSGYWSSC